MENLTPITLPQLDVEALAERAATIRDAINAKSVSAQQVGALFYDLVECCGNVRDALSLFINSNLPEIQQDIDRRLAGVDSAVEKAAAELQKSEAARALVESLVASLSSQNLAAPLRIDIRRCLGSVTLTNAMRPRIDAALFPPLRAWLYFLLRRKLRSKDYACRGNYPGGARHRPDLCRGNWRHVHLSSFDN